MRSVIILLICGVLVAGYQKTSQADTGPQPGAIVENSFLFGYGNARIALPPGKWEVGAVRKNSTSSNTTVREIALYQHINGQLSKVVFARAPMSVNVHGYVRSKFCSRSNLHSRTTLENTNGGRQDCRYVVHWRVQLIGSKNLLMRRLGEWLKERNIIAPTAALVVGYRFSRSSFLDVRYGFNPEIYGFSPPREANWSTSDWHPSNVVRDPRKTEYINHLKSWGDEFYPSVRAGFDGKLAEQFTATSFSPTLTTQKSTEHPSAADRLKKLAALFKQELISKNEYEQRRKEILNSL